MLTIATLLVIGLCFASVSAQTPRNRRSRRITNPVTTTNTPAAQPTPEQPPATNSEARIISTADDPANDDLDDNNPPPATTRRTSRTRATSADPNQDSMRRTVNRLSRQVDTLTDKLNQIEGQQRALVDLERLSRAEQRAEAFRAQLRDVQAKEADLQSRLEQIEYDIKPENIERNTAFYGTTRPDEVRETRRRQLENERTRIRSQLDLISTSRTRLESAIALADTEVERLRARLDEADRAPKTEQSDETDAARTNSFDTATTPARPAPDSSPTGTP
jgi:phage shock protein A